MVNSGLPPLIQSMMQPEFYPHPVHVPIELIQTHASYILLTGDYVYKIKKPVNFGFLNYSTLTARKHFVEEELRLNRRTARALYLEVVPIYQTQTGYSFSPPITHPPPPPERSQRAIPSLQNPVEYALQMRQFPRHSLFSDFLKQGQLTSELMQRLAREVAVFHQQATCNDRIKSFGTVEKIRQAIDENYAQSRPYIGRGQTIQQLAETQAFTDRAFEQWRDIFQTRIEHNNIRECHGDLHLSNICLWNHRVFLFDCIEFNESFRFVDTMYDIAFVVMDCDAQGRPDLGNVFLNAYLEETGDWQGVCVLPLYLSRQAYVRAKVTSLLLDDPAIAPETHQLTQAKAQRYYTQAWQYTQPSPGRLILMSGLSGSGKSTLAKSLAPQIGAIHIRSDAVRKHLAGIPLHQSGPDKIYTPAMTHKTYTRLLDLGLMLAKQGHTVILDAKYDRIVWRTAALAQAQNAGIPIAILVCQAPLEVLKQRVHQRTGDITDATVDILTQQYTSAEALTPEEEAIAQHPSGRSIALYLDTTKDRQNLLESCLHYLH